MREKKGVAVHFGLEDYTLKTIWLNFWVKMHLFFPQRSLIDYEFLWNNLLTVEKRRNIDKKAAQNKLDLIALEPIL